MADINILIDSGTSEDFSMLEHDLDEIGVKCQDINVLINTHEHFDHIGGNIYLQKRSLVAAHKFAAVKIKYGDDEVMMCRSCGQNSIGYKVDLWLNHEDVIDAGSYFLKFLHTPGHTSGCICVYEHRRRLLFSGDTLFADGTISSIFVSGSLGEYFNSLRRLKTIKIDKLLPGHGKESIDVDNDIEKTIKKSIEIFPDAKYLSDMFSF